MPKSTGADGSFFFASAVAVANMLEQEGNVSVRDRLGDLSDFLRIMSKFFMSIESDLVHRTLLLC